MNDTYQQDKPAPYMPMNGGQFVQVALLGAVVGLLVWGISFLLDTYVLKAVFCEGSQIGNCGVSGGYSEAMASIIAAGVGLFVLVRLQVFRPLLVTLATVISLWGIVSIVSAQPWYMVALSCVLLYALAYMLFTWINRLRLFWVVIVLLVVVVVGVRLILTI
jgi:hypothetical protein